MGYSYSTYELMFFDLLFLSGMVHGSMLYGGSDKEIL